MSESNYSVTATAIETRFPNKGLQIHFYGNIESRNNRIKLIKLNVP